MWVILDKNKKVYREIHNPSQIVKSEISGVTFNGLINQSEMTLKDHGIYPLLYKEEELSEKEEFVNNFIYDEEEIKEYRKNSEHYLLISKKYIERNTEDIIVSIKDFFDDFIYNPSTGTYKDHLYSGKGKLIRSKEIFEFIENADPSLKNHENFKFLFENDSFRKEYEIYKEEKNRANADFLSSIRLTFEIKNLALDIEKICSNNKDFNFEKIKLMLAKDIYPLYKNILEKLDTITDNKR